MMKMKFAAGLAVAVLAFAAVQQVRADVYDYGYGPVYSGTSAGCGITCPNGQCSGSYYSPTYTTSYPVYSSPARSQTCPDGSCGPNGSCGGGSCGTCPNGACGLRGRYTDGTCRDGRCGTCPSGDCEQGNCRNCPNGQCTTGQCTTGRCTTGECTTRYRGSNEPLSRPVLPSYERSDYGPRDAADYRPAYSTRRPSYRDDRAETMSRRSWRSDRRPVNRDSDLESPFYN